MKVLTSPFTNPFINLAIEDHFLRGGADLPVLFFYDPVEFLFLALESMWVLCSVRGTPTNLYLWGTLRIV
jgi:hypothetical protein